MRILIVEDDTKIAAFIEKGLKQAGYAVDHVADGESALDMVGFNPYDAAVIDIMLPKLDGLSLIEEMRRQGKNNPRHYRKSSAGNFLTEVETYLIQPDRRGRSCSLPCSEL